jgi:hypothetical protein
MGVGIGIIVFWFMFINHQPAEGVSQMQQLLEEQENRIVFLEQTLEQLQDQVASLNGQLQEQQQHLQKQQPLIAQQQEKLYRQGQQLKEAEQLILLQRRLIDTYQTTQNLWQEQQTSQQDLLQRTMSQLQSQYQSLSQSALINSAGSQHLTQSPNFTPTQSLTRQPVTQGGSSSLTPQGTSESAVSRQEYQRHLFNYQTDLQNQRTRQDTQQLEQIRQDQTDRMQRMRQR